MKICTHWAGYGLGVSAEDIGGTSDTGTSSAWEMGRLREQWGVGKVRLATECFLSFLLCLKEKQGLKYEKLPQQMDTQKLQILQPYQAK